MLRAHVVKVSEAVRSKKFTTSQKAVCAGALLYLVNPLDLIPDAIPVIGYLDDFAVLSLAVAFLAGKSGTCEKTGKTAAVVDAATSS
ncbi:MAG: DUF1232 domain-containing protein [Deltaproteobacteria bacterium]|nr:DUF1232 domain-containing protein [Deltaproteobacteria bacterium]